MTGGMTRVILVMKRPGNVRVIADALASLGAACVAAPDELALEAALGGDLAPAAVLVDAADFGPRIGTICDMLRSRKLPFIALSPPNVSMQARRAFLGAAHHLHKPVGKRLLQELVQGLMQPGSDHQQEWDAGRKGGVCG
ncbi:MAG TPA: response regulator [Gammaproteobacteria bacterium]|jgi:CheY-like chemotaxis protein|nr:response regulator [Gammaproteobacteria bacterium]